MDEATKRTDAAGTRKRVRLVDLRPEWLADHPRRHQMGVSFLCPGHVYANHRIECWFLNPADGDPPRPMNKLFWRSGFTLDELTLAAGTQGKPMVEWLDIPGHWCGYVYDGWVVDALTRGGTSP